MTKERYAISDIYQGSYSSLKPSYGDVFTGYRATAGSLGLTTDPRSANILQEVSSKLSTGVKQIEIEAVSPEVFDSIPKQQLKEVNRLSKLTGVGISIHGPVIGTTGIEREGFSELNREASEEKIIETLKRSHELDPNGNILVNFHSAEGISGSQFLPPSERKKGEQVARMIAVNRQTGRLAPLDREKKFYPSMMERKPDVTEDELERYRKGEIKQEKIFREVPLEEGEILSPERRLDIFNRTEWDNSLSQLIFNKERADEILEKNRVLIQHLEEDLRRGKISPETLAHYPEQRQALNHYKNAETYIEDVHLHLNNLFSNAYEYGDENQRKVLKKISDNFKEELKKDQTIFGQSNAMQNLLHNLKNPSLAPQINVPIEKFAVEQSSKTFGNAAFEAYKKFKNKSPTLVIENPPAGFALSTGEDLKNLVEASRKKFVEKAIKELGISESEAKEKAEKLIGATWDVGHINMLRKYGYESKDIIKESEKIAPFVKHVHLSDNFGFEHTELPMGMGNVPVKEIMEKLGKKGFDAKKIIEAAAWWQHMKSPPVKESMEAMGSPIYSMEMAPFWNQSLGLQQGYYEGYGQMLPQMNYETFGAGFSMLPSELGGQRPGAGGSRMSGRAME